MHFKPHELIRILRLRKGLTQDGMALLLECSQMQVSRYERGTEPAEDVKKKIENLFGVEIWGIRREDQCRM
ncbi:helix-turn-helix transcriptional regulator [Ammoniphilus resinae]|uniref:Transcriptional regulator with XRE-family HTH domain n=1 Tax=Ammoniphilus resinae TaxID=861532 RepID=A0ABS4GNI5_9BACL|nr:transcriptional regulator with XRE-family HTH domain [Ammoniphilus resinae]